MQSLWWSPSRCGGDEHLDGPIQLGDKDASDWESIFESRTATLLIIGHHSCSHRMAHHQCSHHRYSRAGRRQACSPFNPHITASLEQDRPPPDILYLPASTGAAGLLPASFLAPDILYLPAHPSTRRVCVSILDRDDDLHNNQPILTLTYSLTDLQNDDLQTIAISETFKTIRETAFSSELAAPGPRQYQW